MFIMKIVWLLYKRQDKEGVGEELDDDTFIAHMQPLRGWTVDGMDLLCIRNDVHSDFISSRLAPLRPLTYHTTKKS